MRGDVIVTCFSLYTADHIIMTHFQLDYMSAPYASVNKSYIEVGFHGGGEH